MEKDLTNFATEILRPGFWEEKTSLVAAHGNAVSPPPECAPPASVVFATSGSAGEPSWFVLSKEALQISAEAVNRHLEVDSASRWGLALPLHHVGGFGVVARVYQAGCTMARFTGKWNPVRFAEWSAAQSITHSSLVPTQVHDLVVAGASAPPSMTAVVVGGGRLEQSVGQAARDLGWPVLASYGMTETASQVATQGLAALGENYAPSPLPPLPIWEVSLDGDGCFRLAGAALFSGKLVRTGNAWTYRKRQESWFSTRDLGEILPDGQIHMEGRADELVKVLGELVSPSRVEAMLRESARDLTPGGFAIVALADERMGHRLVPVVEASSDFRAIEAAVKSHNASCPGYLRLAEPVVIPNIPRSPLGKVLRKELTRMVRRG